MRTMRHHDNLYNDDDNYDFDDKFDLDGNEYNDSDNAHNADTDNQYKNHHDHSPDVRMRRVYRRVHRRGLRSDCDRE
jgi:hypothetical protein